jgi:predicted DNA-binding transcriptional regulator YafY
MGKRSNTLETTLLAIELLRRIPRHSKVAADQLHQQLKDAGFERDLRTIQRQLDMLSEYFHLERDMRSKPYGYQWPSHSGGLSLPSLSLQESLLLRLAEEYLHHLLPPGLMKSMAGFFAQSRQNLGPGGAQTPEKEWLGKVRVVPMSQPLLPPSIAPGVFDAVCEALYDNRWLDLDYTNAGDVESAIEVMPLGLAQQGPRLYLVCRYAGRDNERNLALHRIRSAKVSTRRFTRPKDFDLKKFDEDGRFGFGEGQKVKLSFLIAKPAGKHLLETPLATDQTVKEHEDQYEISATVRDTPMLDRWLRTFGDEVRRVEKKVIEPGNGR